MHSLLLAILPPAAWDPRLLLIPLLSAAVGWMTNSLAMRLMFRPRRPVRLLGWTVQGVLPRRQGDLARLVGETVEQHLVASPAIQSVFERPEVRETIDRVIRAKIQDFIDAKLVGLNPLIGAFVTGSMRERVEQALMDEILPVIPTLTGQMMDKLSDELDLRGLVERRIENFEIERLESMVYNHGAGELRQIKLLGAAIGFVLGLVLLGVLMAL